LLNTNARAIIISRGLLFEGANLVRLPGREPRFFALFLICTCWSAATQTSAAGRYKSTTAGVDPCTLLASADIQAVQGERVEEVKAAPQSSGGIILQQCTYRTTTPSKSVNLAVATAGAQQTSGDSPREFWQRQFHSNGDEEAREGANAQPVAGLGDEAFWINSPVAGALYVLHGDTFFRLSVGGVRQETERLARSKVLAGIVASRLTNGSIQQASPSRK
jgi:hypothetical protein